MQDYCNCEAACLAWFENDINIFLNRKLRKFHLYKSWKWVKSTVSNSPCNIFTESNHLQWKILGLASLKLLCTCVHFARMNACSYILASICSPCSKKWVAYKCMNLLPLVSFVFSEWLNFQPQRFVRFSLAKTMDPQHIQILQLGLLG